LSTKSLSATKVSVVESGVAFDPVLRDGPDRLEHLHLLLAHRPGVEGDGRLHRRQAEDLHNVVLNDVAQGACLLVEGAARPDPDVLGDRDLDVVHVVLVPDRLEDAVGEPQGQDVLDRVLAEVVVYAVDLVFLEVAPEVGVELPGAPQVPPERLLHHEPGVGAVLLPVHTRLAQVLDYRREERGRRREVVDAVPLRPPLVIEMVQEPLELLVGLRLLRVAGQVEDALRERLPDVLADLTRAVLLEGVAQLLAEIVVAQLRARDPDDGELHRQTTLRRQIVECRDQLPARQIP
jgi:hypothetical protein